MTMTPKGAAAFVQALNRGASIAVLSEIADISNDHARMIVYRMMRENMVYRDGNFWFLTREARRILPAIIHVLETMGE